MSKNSKTSLFSNIKSVDISQLPEQKKSYNKISIKSVKYKINKQKKDNNFLDQILSKQFLINYFKT